MKRMLLLLLMMTTVFFAHSQLTYYWVGGAATTPNISLGANWKTNIDGTGSSRGSSTNDADILVFDGTNLGGATPLTGPVTVNVNGSISCGQMRFVNNAQIRFIRSTAGTSTVTLAGDGNVSEDFLIEAGSSLSIIPTSVGSLRVAMAATATARVSGSLSIVTNALAARFDNTTAGVTGSFRFTNGSSFTTNITGSGSYAFGGSTQSSDRWVVFEPGAHLYYDGGTSPNGSASGENIFSAIDMKPGSVWHHRATNATSSVGNFFKDQSYGDIIVENNASLVAMGSLYQVDNLTINTGSSFITDNAGQTVVLGNLVVDGNLSSPASGTNELVMGGDAAQSISGAGSVNIASLIIADHANVSLNKNMAIDRSVKIYGKLNFVANQLTGNGSFSANGKITPLTATGNLTAGTYMITGTSGVAAASHGLSVTGTGIAANTTVVAHVSGTADTLFLSKPLLASGTGVAISLTSNGATLATANASGFDPATGSVLLAGNKSYEDGINYIINAATSWPLGISTGSSGTSVNLGFAEINAPVTLNNGMTINDHLTINNKITLRSSDILHIKTGAVVNGSISSSNYIATGYDAVAGAQSKVQYDGITTATIMPIGTVNYYLPVTITPVTVGDFTASVFEGITANGEVNGTPLTALQRLTLVNAVWTINRLSGAGNSDLQLGWNANLEGTTFATLPNTDIGLIRNTGSSFSIPTGVADNTANTVTATVGTFGAFSIGAVPQTDPFVFNDLPAKTYGDVDFNGGATSLNTTQPIVYSSSNTSVATIVNGDIHITGAGTTDITASQATDGVYPAVTMTKTLSVGKAALTITAENKTRFEGLANPTLTISYSGFVYNETPAVLLTAAVITTTATPASAPGDYPITVSGATSANYTISFVNGVMTVNPKTGQVITFNALPVKNYGNPDFATGGTSTNNTIPIVYTSSNTNVATIIGTNIHIVGAGTANITASQAGSDSYFAASNVVRELVVNKVPLTIRVRDTTRAQGQPNPPFTITYTGFVLGETPASLTTAVTASTIAGVNFPPGYYPIILGGAVSANYAITYTNARLTVLPLDNTRQTLYAFMPNNSTLTVRVFSLQPSLADIVLYNISGQPVLRKNLFMPVGFINSDLPVGKLPSGIYTVVIKGNGVDLKKTVSIIK